MSGCADAHRARYSGFPTFPQLCTLSVSNVSFPFPLKKAEASALQAHHSHNLVVTHLVALLMGHSSRPAHFHSSTLVSGEATVNAHEVKDMESRGLQHILATCDDFRPSNIVPW